MKKHTLLIPHIDSVENKISLNELKYLSEVPSRRYQWKEG